MSAPPAPHPTSEVVPAVPTQKKPTVRIGLPPKPGAKQTKRVDLPARSVIPAPAPAPRLSNMLPMVPGFGSLPAVINGNLHEVSSDLLLTAPGPRIVDAVEEIAGLLNTSSPVYY